MEIIDSINKFVYCTEQLNELIEIIRQNDYDLFLLPAFIEDLEGFLKELKELRKLAEDV